jgi:hypothetical protein
MPPQAFDEVLAAVHVSLLDGRLPASHSWSGVGNASIDGGT